MGSGETLGVVSLGTTYHRARELGFLAEAWAICRAVLHPRFQVPHQMRVEGWAGA